MRTPTRDRKARELRKGGVARFVAGLALVLCACGGDGDTAANAEAAAVGDAGGAQAPAEVAAAVGRLVAE